MRHARRPGVLLGTGEKQAIAAGVDRPREDIARSVADQRHVAHFGLGGELHALDGFVRGEVGVGRVGVELEFARFRHAVVVARLAVEGDLHGPLGLGLVGGLFRPRAGDDIVGRLARVPQEAHGDHAELQQGPALQEEDAVVGGNAQQRAKIGFGLVQNLLELLRAVADLQDRDAGARQGQQVALGLFQGRQGQNGRTGRKIVDALFHDQNPPAKSCRTGSGTMSGTMYPWSWSARRFPNGLGRPSDEIIKPIPVAQLSSAANAAR